MENKVSCSSFNEFMTLAEANAKEANEGKEPPIVARFWIKGPAKGWVDGSIQAGMLGLYKSGLLSAKGDGENTKFYMTGSGSPFKFLFRVRKTTAEIFTAILLFHGLNALANFRTELLDHAGFAVSVAVTIFYMLRLLRMLHMGPLVCTLPIHSQAFGRVTMPLVRGVTMFMGVLAAGYVLLFWYRITGQMAYPTTSPLWIMIPQSFVAPVLMGSLYFVGLWMVGVCLNGEVSNANRIISKYGLNSLFKHDDLLDHHRVQDKAKLIGFVFAVGLCIFGAYPPMFNQWI
jgi:hypothetical protein|tara:strand:- start:171 stop:1034 length:864 start_codon:yes stop_codon:yes gene_type:complete